MAVCRRVCEEVARATGAEVGEKFISIFRRQKYRIPRIKSFCDLDARKILFLCVQNYSFFFFSALLAPPLLLHQGEGGIRRLSTVRLRRHAAWNLKKRRSLRLFSTSLDSCQCGDV